MDDESKGTAGDQSVEPEEIKSEEPIDFKIYDDLEDINDKWTKDTLNDDLGDINDKWTEDMLNGDLDFGDINDKWTEDMLNADLDFGDIKDKWTLEDVRESERKELLSKDQTSQQDQFSNSNSNVTKCSHCHMEKTPQWRTGPLGPKTLCNACGLWYKEKEKLDPEYRPIKSSSFSPTKHSNKRRKVMELRRQKNL